MLRSWLPQRNTMQQDKVINQDIIWMMATGAVHRPPHTHRSTPLHSLQPHVCNRLIEYGLTSHQHIIGHIGDGFLRVKWSNQQR